MKLGGWSCTGRGLVRFRLAGSQRSRRALCLASTVGGNAEPRRGLPTLLGVSLQDDLHQRRPPGHENSSRVSRPGPAVPRGRLRGLGGAHAYVACLLGRL